MSLLDDLETPLNSRCGYAAALAQLADEERAAVEEAVADSDWGPKHLEEVLRRNGVLVTRKHIGRHRRGDCAQCR